MFCGNLKVLPCCFWLWWWYLIRLCYEFPIIFQLITSNLVDFFFLMDYSCSFQERFLPVFTQGHYEQLSGTCSSTRLKRKVKATSVPPAAVLTADEKWLRAMSEHLKGLLIFERGIRLLCFCPSWGGVKVPKVSAPLLKLKKLRNSNGVEPVHTYHFIWPTYWETPDLATWTWRQLALCGPHLAVWPFSG